MRNTFLHACVCARPTPQHQLTHLPRHTNNPLTKRKTPMV